MKASEMTNEMLAKQLMSRVPLDSDRHDDLREAAARLRNLGEFGEAVGHESTSEKSSQAGNSAKLKEACEAIMSEIGSYLTDGLEVIWCSISGKTIKKARAALSALPRNCDLFDTKDKAREAFQKLRGHSILADVSLWDDRDEIEAFFDWLFTEAKGETK